jgi:hypothetical protein
MNDPLPNVRRRVFQYGFIDGSVELSLGGLCLLLGLYFLLQASLPAGTPLAALLDASLVLVIIGGVYLINRLVRRFKERITYPRSGYIAFRQVSGPARLVRSVLLGAAAMLISVLVTLLLTNAELGMAWMPAMTGIIFGLVLGFMAYRSGLLRMALLALLAIILGGGLMALGIGDIFGLAVFYLLIALALFVSGVCALWGYLRSTPPPEAGDEP